MNPFMQDGGFIGPSFGKWIKHCRIIHAQFFQLAEDVNRQAHALVVQRAEKMGQVSKGEQERLAFTLLLRGTGIFQGVILLAERGMVAEMGILTRSLLETEFKLAVAIRSPEDAVQLLLNDRFARRASLEAALKVPQSLTPKDLRQFKTEIEYLNVELKGKSRKWSKIEKLAERADQSDFYNLYYRYFCGAVHSNPSDLKQHVSVTSNKKGIRFRMGPRFEAVPFFLSMSVFVHLQLLRVAACFFELETETALKHLDQRLKSFGPTISKPTW